MLATIFWVCQSHQRIGCKRKRFLLDTSSHLAILILTVIAAMAVNNHSQSYQEQQRDRPGEAAATPNFGKVLNPSALAER